MEDSPLFQLIYIGLIAYFFHLWLSDLRQHRKGSPNPKAIQGATPSNRIVCTIGALGALIILGFETGGEIALGISDEQKNITLLFALVTLCAPIVEEIIFRGYLVLQNHGKKMLLLSIFGCSLLFTLLHPFLWTWEDKQLVLHFTTKAWFSSTIILANSLWFYYLRFSARNPQRSLIPCFIAHFASNLGVVLIKAFQGHLIGWY